MYILIEMCILIKMYGRTFKNVTPSSGRVGNVQFLVGPEFVKVFLLFWLQAGFEICKIQFDSITSRIVLTDFFSNSVNRSRGKTSEYTPTLTRKYSSRENIHSTPSSSR